MTLAVEAVPATARAATPLAPAIVVQVRRGSQPAASLPGPITVAIDSGVGVLQGSTTATVSRGQAAFNDLRIGGVGRFVLRFSAPGVSEARSGAIVVTPDPGSRLFLRTAPSSTLLTGATFTTQPVVDTRDLAGGTISYPVAIQATLVRGNGALTGGTSSVTSGGSAAFSGLGATGFSSATMRFSAFGFTSVDANFTIQDYALYVRPRLPNDRDTITVARGDGVDVEVRLLSGPNDIVGSTRFDVVWDPRVLTLVSDQPVAGVSATFNRAQQAQGVLQVTATATAGLSGAAVLLQLRFRAEQAGEGPISTRILEVRAPDGRDIYRSNLSSTVRVLVP